MDGLLGEVFSFCMSGRAIRVDIRHHRHFAFLKLAEKPH